jgi:hypothetical protein
MWTDPSGEQVDDCDDPASRTCPLFADGWIAANKADILAAAKMHERPEVGFDELTLAILMGAILITENNYREVVADEDWPHIPRRTKGDLAGVTRESWDSSSGPGNITISAANRAFDGTVRVVAGVDYSDPNDPRFIYLELCSSETVSFSTQTFYDELLDLMHRVPNGNNLISDEKMVMLSTLKNTRHNLDVMATILAQGIIAAHALRLQPTFFNLGTWYNGSVLKTEHIEIRGNAGYGASIAGLNAPAGDLGSPQRAARALNLADHIIPRSIIASEDERMLYDEVVGR